MKHFLKKIFIYGFLVFVAINLIAWLSLSSLQNSSFYKPSYLKYEIKEENFDYIVIGSSVGLTGLDTKLIDSIQKTKGINLSMDGTFLNSNHLMLQHFFALNKKTNYCILAVNPNDIANSKPKLNLNDYRFLPFINEDYVFEYYNKMENDNFKILSNSKYFPFLGVSLYNSELFYPSLLVAIHPKTHNRFDDNGNYAYVGNTVLEDKKIKKIIINWNNPYVEKIKNLCLKNKTKLIIYLAPKYKTEVENQNKKYEIINFTSEIVDSKMFYDSIHINESGRRQVSEKIAKTLIMK
jgi:hypothetical protein